MSKEIKKLQCEDAVRMLLQYLDSELDDDTLASMQQHLHTCRSCFTRYEFEKRLKNMVKDQKKLKAPDSLRHKLKNITDKF